MVPPVCCIDDEPLLRRWIVLDLDCDQSPVGDGCRDQMLRHAAPSLDVANQMRGLMKTFGLIIPRSMGGKFEANVRSLLADDANLARIILPLLEAWRALRKRAGKLTRQLLASARRSEQCQLLMSIPGVGAITATSYLTRVEIPPNSNDRVRSEPGLD